MIFFFKFRPVLARRNAGFLIIIPGQLVQQGQTAFYHTLEYKYSQSIIKTNLQMIARSKGQKQVLKYERSDSEML